MPLQPTTLREIHNFILMNFKNTEEGEAAQYRVVAGYYAQLFDIYEQGLTSEDEELDHMLANRRWEVEAYANERGWTIDRDYTYPEANGKDLISAPKSKYTPIEWRTSHS